MSKLLYIGFLAERDEDEEEEKLRISTRLPIVAEINALLQKHGLPEQNEPREFPDTPEHQGYWNAILSSTCEGELKELLNDLMDTEDLNISKNCANHLLKVDFGKGFWVPLDFPKVITNKSVHVGSAYRLIEICQALAEHFEFPMPLDEIPLDESGDLSDLNEFFEEQTGDSLWDQEDGSSKELCIALYQAAKLSILKKMMLCCG